LSVPLKRQENILGVLNIADKQSRVPFDQDDLDLTLTLAAEAAIAVENAKLYLDIKEKMLSLEDLYRSRETERRQLLTLINSINDAILAVDLEKRPLFINRKARSLLRIPEEQDGKHLMKDLLEPGELSRAIIEGMESAFTPASTSREVTLEKTASGRRHYEIVSLPIWEKEGDLIGVLSIVRDMTEFKELDRIRSDFLTHASHQLKTPVGLIQGFSDTMVKHADMEEDRRLHFLKLIHSEASRLGSLIENLLDFTRLESKTMPVEMERVQVEAVLEEILPAVRGKAEEKGIRFHTSLESSLPVIETDRKCLMEVLQNILDNSLKFTPRGGKITVGVGQDRERLELMVSDTGSGIEEGDLPHIFDKFYVGRSTGRPGTGLGLFLAKEIIDSVGGSITVTSREGRGTTVKIMLPVGKGGPAEVYGGSR
jgi:PAS domain S-box-containing protein